MNTFAAVTLASKAREPRLLDLDPDFRRIAKTNRTCWMCGKDIKPTTKARQICGYGGITIIHPDDAPKTGGDWLLVGPDCARRIGLEWTREEPRP